MFVSHYLKQVKEVVLPLAATSLLAQRTMSSSVISPLDPTQSHNRNTQISYLDAYMTTPRVAFSISQLVGTRGPLPRVCLRRTRPWRACGGA